MSELRDRLAEALALAFTPEHGERNPDWDAYGPDDETNPYYKPIPLSSRVEMQPHVHWTASDGYPSFAAASIPEILDVVMPIIESSVEELVRAFLDVLEEDCG